MPPPHAPPAHLPLLLQVQDDLKRIFDTGYFHLIDYHPEDTRDGVKLSVEVRAGQGRAGAGTGGGGVGCWAGGLKAWGSPQRGRGGLSPGRQGGLRRRQRRPAYTVVVPKAWLAGCTEPSLPPCPAPTPTSSNPAPPRVQVAANPTLRGLSTVGANVLPQSVIQGAFANMYGRPLNYVQLSAAVKKLAQWYEDNGVLGQVRERVRGCWGGWVTAGEGGWAR